jgi:hypothetical protein
VYDPSLKAINSSAGEMGNSCIHRIRKSLSYMTQSHAILYITTFLSLYNRVTRLRNKLEG